MIMAKSKQGIDKLSEEGSSVLKKIIDFVIKSKSALSVHEVNVFTGNTLKQMCNLIEDGEYDEDSRMIDDSFKKGYIEGLHKALGLLDIICKATMAPAMAEAAEKGMDINPESFDKLAELGKEQKEKCEACDKRDECDKHKEEIIEDDYDFGAEA